MRIVYLVVFFGLFHCGFSQQISMKLEKSIAALQQDKQFDHSIISLDVVEDKTGKTIYAKNIQAGLAPASCQKIITSATAFELLGKDYLYKTQFGYSGNIINNTLDGNLYMVGNGDPTLGSWRWKETSEDFIINKLITEFGKLNISKINSFIIDNTKWGTQTLPDGWVWQDIGNYYGAGCSSFNWHENQYDIVLKPGKKIGDSVKISSVNPIGLARTINELTTAGPGTGDQANVYYAPYSLVNFLRGTIPLGVDSLTISASVKTNFSNYLSGETFTGSIETKICDFVSPPFDSINYWFLKKSINLYGEVFVKTIAWEKKRVGSTDTGVNIIRDFWADKGIERPALKIIDGSGLSPANRVTTDALVKILQYAKQRPWFSSFYNALPEINGIKMKDGYIGGVRSYSGYIKSAGGTEYIFAFIVNNFDGNPSEVRQKMWKVLNLLK